MAKRRSTPTQLTLSGQAFRKLIDGNLKEATWQKQVEEALTVCGWWWMHVPPNVVVCPRCHTKVYRGIRKGFPDLFAIKPPHKLWLELKTERGQLEPEQREVLDMLAACGETVLFARPRDREHLLNLIAHPEAGSL